MVPRTLQSSPCRLNSQQVPNTLEVMAQPRPLLRADGPLVWIDLEMSGLDPIKNRIMEVAVLITNGNLELVDEDGCELVVKSTEGTMAEMHEWCVNQHGVSGLLTKTEESTQTAPEVADEVLSYIQRWIPEPGTAQMAGSSVWFDSMFLRATGPDVAEHGGRLIWRKIVEHLNYRIVDVSSIKEVCKRWYPDVRQAYNKQKGQSNHRALDDIRHSIAELRFYRENIFVKP